MTQQTTGLPCPLPPTFPTAEDVAYFTEWGRPPWRRFLATAVCHLQSKRPLKECRVLDFGTRYGKSAALFALLGAETVGIDTDPIGIERAWEEARKWGLGNCSFQVTQGDLDMFADESFDVIFSKSVLVCISNWQDVLQTIIRKLRPGGRLVLIENGNGNLLMRIIRRWHHYRHPSWQTEFSYMSPEHLHYLREHFTQELCQNSAVPPVHLFIGAKKPLA